METNLKIKKERKTRTLSIWGGFHNTRQDFRIPREWWDSEKGWAVPKAEKEILAAKFSRALCGMSDCKCYGGYGEVGYMVDGADVPTPLIDGNAWEIAEEERKAKVEE